MSKSTQTFHFDELDQSSRDYLLAARDRQGRGMPGLFLPTPNHLPVAGFIGGIVVLVVMGIISWNQIEQEPLGVAMLQTVGLLLGGWMVIAAIRVWVAAAGKNYAGHFIYADGETLWECKGSTVTATDLFGVQQAEGTSNYNQQGKYQNTTVKIDLEYASRQLTLGSERGAEQLTIFVNTLAWLRHGGDSKKNPEAPDPSKLPSAILGGIARENAVADYLPKNWSASGLDIDYEDVPHPKRARRAASGLLQCLIIIVAAVGSVFLFKMLNVGWRDDAIWNNIGTINDSDARAPWIRAYLADARNTNHRDEAKQMLRDIYARNVARIRNSTVMAVNPGNFNAKAGPFVNPNFKLPNPNAVRVDGELVDGLEVVLLELAELPLPDVSISVKDTTPDKSQAAREKRVIENFGKAVYEGVGEQLVRIAQAPPDTKGMIDITFAFNRDEDGEQVSFTLSFRKAPNAEPARTVVRTFNARSDSIDALGSLATNLGLATAGPPKPKPAPQIELD